MLLHCLTAMKFPFAKGVDHKQMLQNILDTSMNHEEAKSQVSIIIHFVDFAVESKVQGLVFDSGRNGQPPKQRSWR